jgi:hypothetical protein
MVSAGVPVRPGDHDMIEMAGRLVDNLEASIVSMLARRGHADAAELILQDQHWEAPRG